MTFNFATRTAYLTAKASNGALYNYLNGASTAKSCISYIVETNETFVDSINLTVPVNDGQIGDVLCWNSTLSIWCWLKSNKTFSGQSELGGDYVGSLPTTIYKMGILVRRDGDDCLIMALSDGTGKAWDANYSETSTYTVTGTITTQSSIKLPTGSSWIASGSKYLGRRYGSSQTGGTYRYTYPISESIWKTVCDAVKSNTAITSTTLGNVTYSVTQGTNRGTSSISYLATTDTTLTTTVEEWNFDYDAWYKHKVLLEFPTNTGCMIDWDGYSSSYGGWRNTKAILDAASSSGRSFPAATFCNTYAPTNAQSGFTAGCWWLPSVVELYFVLRNYEIFERKGIAPASTWYWSSTQYSSSYAWYVLFFAGGVRHLTKSYTGYVRPFTSFHINS